MIVRNEADNIERCLQSLAPWISRWVIVDTGSEDDTPQIIERFFAARGIPGLLHHSTFSDFSTSRNEALELGRQSAADCDYLLLIDADMELVAEDDAWAARLDRAAYSLRQHSGIIYDNVRLVRRDHHSHYVGVTHEYLETGEVPERLAGVHMIDHASGGNRPGKSERDIELLRRGLREEPHNPRYLFYLAQSLRDAGRYEEALMYYRQRADAGGWEEEAWYAQYRAAACLFAIGKHDEAVAMALEAWERRPARLEPLALLCGHYREQERYNLCCAFAGMGLGRPFPGEDRLFIEPDLYHWRFMQDLSIAGFYADDPAQRALGAQCCERLALDREVPDFVRQLARSHARFYARRADELFGLQILASYEAHGGACFNPSICIDGEQRAMVLRQANYRLDGRKYLIDDPQGVIRTENFLLELDGEYRPGALRPIVAHPDLDDSALAPRLPFPVRGYEDCRLLRWRGCWWASATVRDTSPQGTCTIALLQLDAQGRILQEFLLPGGHAGDQANDQANNQQGRHEKNWMPFLWQDCLHFIYLLDPVTVLRLDESTGSVERVCVQPPEAALDHLRGGGQLLALGEACPDDSPPAGGWLGICHESTGSGGAPGHYLHRFFRLDGDFRLQALSEAFSLTGAEVEFCAGLAREPGTDRLLLSFGIGDAVATLGAAPLDRVLRLLRRID